MRETLELLEEHLRHTSVMARQTLDIVLTDARPANLRYRLILKKLEEIKKAQAFYLRAGRPQPDGSHEPEDPVTIFLNHVAEEHRAIETAITTLLAIPWPRSPQAGLHALQKQAFQLLTDLLQLIERELLEMVSIRQAFESCRENSGLTRAEPVGSNGGGSV